MAGPISYHVHDECNEVIDEKGNVIVAIRKINWGEESNPEKAKLDIRKWYVSSSGEETVGKGVSFLTEEGPNTLAKILVDKGFGHTTDIVNGIKDREDFRPALNKVLGKDDEAYDDTVPENFYTPGEQFFNYEDGDE